MTSFSSERTVTARKPHRCEVCRQTITIGTRYRQVAGRHDGDFCYGRMHPDCRALWHALFDDWGDPWEGMAWDLSEVMCDSGEVVGAQRSLDAQRGFFPHAVNRLEFRLRGWLNREVPTE